MVTSIKFDEATEEVFIDQNTFWKFKNEYATYKDSVIDDDMGVFDEWARVIIYQHLNYAYMLFAQNPTLSADMTESIYRRSKDYALKTIEFIKELETIAPCFQNNDEIGLVSLFKAYVYRNLFVIKKHLNEDDCLDWLKLTIKERAALKNNFGGGTIDTQLYNNFCMEYYLSLVNLLSTDESVDPFEVEMYRAEMSAYIDSVMSGNTENMYLKQMARWCKKKS